MSVAQTQLGQWYARKTHPTPAVRDSVSSESYVFIEVFLAEKSNQHYEKSVDEESSHEQVVVDNPSPKIVGTSSEAFEAQADVLEDRGRS